MDAQVNQFFYGFIEDTINLKILIADYNSFFINVSLGTQQIQDIEKQKIEINKRFNAMQPDQKGQLLNLLNALRRIAFSLQTDLNSLQKHIKLSDKIKEEINLNYQEIEESSMPDYKKCKNFLQALNDIKVNYINVEAFITTPKKDQDAIASMKTPKGASVD